MGYDIKMDLLLWMIGTSIWFALGFTTGIMFTFRRVRREGYKIVKEIE